MLFQLDLPTVRPFPMEVMRLPIHGDLLQIVGTARVSLHKPVPTPGRPGFTTKTVGMAKLRNSWHLNVQALRFAWNEQKQVFRKSGPCILLAFCLWQPTRNGVTMQVFVGSMRRAALCAGAHRAPVAQLDRALVSGNGGFQSCCLLSVVYSGVRWGYLWQFGLVWA